MNGDDRVKLSNAGDASHLGIDKDAIGSVLRAYVDEGNVPRADVQFDGPEPLLGWHPAKFVLADPVD